MKISRYYVSQFNLRYIYRKLGITQTPTKLILHYY